MEKIFPTRKSQLLDADRNGKEEILFIFIIKI